MFFANSCMRVVAYIFALTGRFAKNRLKVVDFRRFLVRLSLPVWGAWIEISITAGITLATGVAPCLGSHTLSMPHVRGDELAMMNQIKKDKSMTQEQKIEKIEEYQENMKNIYRKMKDVHQAYKRTKEKEQEKSRSK